MRRFFVNIRPFCITNGLYTTKGLERNRVRSGIRDNFDNYITVCNMENIDPLSIHMVSVETKEQKNTKVNADILRALKTNSFEFYKGRLTG